MAHEFSKLLLERARTFQERQKAVRVAVRLGMPLHEIEEYLDWLDNLRNAKKNATNHRPTQRPHSDQRNPEKHD
jgi:DNA-binding transcriptional MerR regulator